MVRVEREDIDWCAPQSADFGINPPHVLGEEGIQVSQLVIGGRIIPGDESKDPGVLAGHLWDLHVKRDRFRIQVSED